MSAVDCLFDFVAKSVFDQGCLFNELVCPGTFMARDLTAMYVGGGILMVNRSLLG